MSIIDKVSGRAKKGAGDLLGMAGLRSEGRKEEIKGEKKEQLTQTQRKAEKEAGEVADLERRT